MEWQRDAVDINYIKAIAVLREKDMYEGIAVGNRFSGGNYGMFYKEIEDLLDEDRESKYPVCTVIDMLKEDIEENDELSDQDKKDISITIDALKKIDGYLWIEHPDAGEVEFETKTFDDICIDSFLGDSMNGHSFVGSIDEAINELKSQFSYSDGIKKNVWEIVNWCSRQFDWRSLEDDFIVNLLADELNEVFLTDDGYFKYKLEYGMVYILPKKSHNILKEIRSQENGQIEDWEDEEDYFYLKEATLSNILYVSDDFNFDFEKFWEAIKGEKDDI